MVGELAGQGQAEPGGAIDIVAADAVAPAARAMLVLREMARLGTLQESAPSEEQLRLGGEVRRLEAWLKRDPIQLYRARLVEFGVPEEQVAAIEAESRRKVDEATEAAKAAPPPPSEILTTDVYADGGWAWRN